MTAKILVIEDADALRRDVIEMLVFEGFEAEGAENGRIGVTKAYDYNPDLIICDIMMPELDGYGVLDELQQDGAGITVPFIFLTAKTDKSDIRQGMLSGANDYLTKPFTASDLIACVKKQLEKREKIHSISEEKLEELRDSIILSLPHELRTPLTGILGFSDILMTDCHFMEPDKVAEMSQYVYSAAQRLYRLTENYLAYAQLEVMRNDKGRMDAMRRFTTSDPRVLIEDVAMQKAQSYHREADLQLEVSNELPVQMLEDNLKKIVEELVDNAFKFSAPETPVKVTGRVADGQYVLEVTNQGRGITPQQAARIGAFIQFGRKSFEQQGSGLGLTIVKRSVEMHGGTFHVQSEPNRETRISVHLPIAAEPVAAR